MGDEAFSEIKKKKSPSLKAPRDHFIPGKTAINIEIPIFYNDF